MVHFNHPRELTDVAIEGMNLLKLAGTEAANQTPLIRGVNDDPEVLAELFNQLSYKGIPPYYLFICRPTLGNMTYVVPIVDAFGLFEKAADIFQGGSLTKGVEEYTLNARDARKDGDERPCTQE